MLRYPEAGTARVRHRSARDAWDMALCAPDPRLRASVRGYCLYAEQISSFRHRREIPSGDVTLILVLGEPLEVVDASGEIRCFRAGEGFVAGLHDAPALAGGRGRQMGVEIKLTPIGAHRLLGGAPMHALANRVVPLDALFGRAPGALAERLREAREPAERFALLDAFARSRVGAAPDRVAPEVEHVWRRLVARHGGVAIGGLSREIGWSGKRLVAAFREQLGLAPKTLARILRFRRAVDHVGSGPPVRWTDVAIRCGYHDQAHLVREVRALAGCTPGELARRALPDSGGIAAAD